MTIEFLKMHGLGNDFILVDARDYDFDEARWRDLAVRWCDRHFGIGADGLLLAWPSSSADVRMQIYNPDGSEPEMCGNGIRCFAKFLVDSGRHIANNRHMIIETQTGNLPVSFTQNEGGVDQVTVDMGPAGLDVSTFPVDHSYVRNDGQPAIATIEVAGRSLDLRLVSMGNPHAIAFLDEPIDDFPLLEIGPLVEHHPAFPERINFEIMNRLPDRLGMRVWERGAGATLACGTGACAVSVADQLLTGERGPRTVQLPGGSLRIEWDGRGRVMMTGPATESFRGTTPA